MQLDHHQFPQTDQIIAHYQGRISVFKKYAIFSLGGLLGLGLFLTYAFQTPKETTLNKTDLTSIGFVKSGTNVTANQIYIAPEGFTLGDFEATILGGRYRFADGKHLSKNNMISYAGHMLPINISVTAGDYLGATIQEQINNYIQRFIVLDTGSLAQYSPSIPQPVLLEGNPMDVFSLDCLDSKLNIYPQFCNHNLELFAQNVRKYDMIGWLEDINTVFQSIQEEDTRNALCQSIINFEFLTNQSDGRFSTMLNSCNPKFIGIHQLVGKRKKLNKELATVLSPELDNDSKRNELKLVSSMQTIQTQLSANKADTAFLNSYYEFVSQLLKQSDLDQFIIDLIYKYHNQYLLKGLLDVQKVVDLDAVQDIQHIIDKFDTLNNGDSQNLIGLKNTVTQSIVTSTDYAQEHPSLGETNISTGSTGGIDIGIINTLIEQVDNSINQELENSGTNTQNPALSGSSNNGNTSPINSSIDQIPTNTNVQQNNNPVSNTENGELDLNTYKPKTTPVYQPGASATDTNTLISDRMYNNLGIKPSTIVAKGSKYFLGRTYKNFEFAAQLDKQNDWLLSPIYVKVDNHLVSIPDLQIYLMDYDRYTQIKFLKNPDTYVRSATQ